jgi:hypothetical protein
MRHLTSMVADMAITTVRLVMARMCEVEAGLERGSMMYCSVQKLSLKSFIILSMSAEPHWGWLSANLRKKAKTGKNTPKKKKAKRRLASVLGDLSLCSRHATPCPRQLLEALKLCAKAGKVVF